MYLRCLPQLVLFHVALTCQSWGNENDSQAENEEGMAFQERNFEAALETTGGAWNSAGGLGARGGGVGDKVAQLDKIDRLRSL